MQTTVLTVDDMLSNAAMASQHLPLLNDPVVRGAVLRSINQWIALSWRDQFSELQRDLQNHPDYES